MRKEGLQGKEEESDKLGRDMEGAEGGVLKRRRLECAWRGVR